MSRKNFAAFEFFGNRLHERKFYCTRDKDCEYRGQYKPAE